MAASLRLLILLPVFFASAMAGETPAPMVANVYRLSEAGAALEVCFASPAFKSIAADKAEALRNDARRLERLVKAIGQYYGDGDIFTIYAATRARIAAEPAVQERVTKQYGECGDGLLAAMDKYVLENELLIGRYVSEPHPKPVQRKPPEPGPPAKR